MADDVTVPVQLAQLLAAAYGVPTTQKVALRLNCVDKKKGSTTYLETYRAQSAAIPVSYFAAPSGYKLVNSEAEVMMTADQKQMIEDMSRDLGSGKDMAPGAVPQTNIPEAAGSDKSAGIPTAGTGAAVLPGGVKVTRDDLNRLLDAFKKAKNSK